MRCNDKLLFSVVSELWGSRCVRLKVTVKSDNCGENEDCSGKGLCYSNNSMVSKLSPYAYNCRISKLY